LKDRNREDYLLSNNLKLAIEKAEWFLKSPYYTLGMEDFLYVRNIIIKPLLERVKETL
jgi:hypothetical protein